MFEIQHTEEYKAIGELKSLEVITKQALNTVRELSRRGYDIFWNGQTDVAKKMELLGPKADEVFSTFLKTEAFLKSIDPTYEELGIPAGITLEWNEDGSARIVE